MRPAPRPGSRSRTSRTRALVAVQPADIPRLDEVGVNGTVVAVHALRSRSRRAWPSASCRRCSSPARACRRALREGTRGGASGGGHRMRAALVVAEMALAVVLLIGAGLLIRSFIQLTRVNPGFQAEQALSFRVTLQGEKYRQDAPDPDSRGRVRGTPARACPASAAVAATSVLPLSGRGAMLGFAVEGAPPPPPNVNAEIAVASATPDYFRAIGAPLSPRPCASPTRTTPRRRAWRSSTRLPSGAGSPDQDPIGKRVNINGVPREVVGVVADVLQRSPAEPAVPHALRAVRAADDPVRQDRRPGDGRSGCARDGHSNRDPRARPGSGDCRHHAARRSSSPDRWHARASTPACCRSLPPSRSCWRRPASSAS